MTTIYRNYLIARLGDQFVAQSQDDESLLVSKDQQRLNAAIDDLWSSLEKGVSPAWFSGSTAIDLDTYGPETNASETDPPVSETGHPPRRVSYLMFGVTAVLVSATLSYLVQIFDFKHIDVMLSIGVCSVAVAFGRKFALLASCISALVYNFFCCDLLLAFEIPTISELVFAAMNVVASYGIPILLNLKCLGRLGRGRTLDT